MSMTVDPRFQARLARIAADPGASAVPTPGDTTGGGSMSKLAYKRTLAAGMDRPAMAHPVTGSLVLAILSMLSFAATLVAADMFFPIAETTWTEQSWFLAVMAGALLVGICAAQSLGVTPPLAVPQVAVWILVAEAVSYEALYRYPSEAALALSDTLIGSVASLTAAGEAPATLALNGLL